MDQVVGIVSPSNQNKKGWPWSSTMKGMHSALPDNSPWPKITIITPSYNQGQFLEETIRSVLLQNYPNLEYIIMDGGSSDKSLEIIKKYEPWLTYWVSEKDNGQADAIYRGFEKATGDIIGWLNSDDYLLPGALQKVAVSFMKNSEVEFVIGGGLVVDAEGRLIRKLYSFPQTFESLLVGGQYFMQMSSFWRRDVYLAVGGLDSSLRFCFDYDLFLKLARRRTPAGFDAMLSAFRIHDVSKTSTIWETVALPEIEFIRQRYGVESFSNEHRQNLWNESNREFYRITREGILKDICRDPGFFSRCILNKLLRRPGSPLLGTEARTKA